MNRFDQVALRTARLAAWEARVAGLLAAAAGAARSRGAYAELAAAVVGMFDAGARDAEVAVFLRAAGLPELGAMPDDRLAALVAELHLAAKR
jgi:hypothetical protein